MATLNLSAAPSEGSHKNPTSHPMKLQTSIMHRWLAVAGQAATIVFVHFVLGIKLPLFWCFIPIILSANLNVTLTILFPSNMRVAPIYASALLTYDLLQLATLFYFTGGIENPFIFLMLVPVTISATLLPMRHTFLLGVFAMSLISLLVVFHDDLSWRDGTEIFFPVQYIVGIWFSLLIVMTFLAVYIRRISYESHAMSAALSATRLMLEREQKLSALDGLASGAAHELGSPLSTITLVAKELKYELKDKAELQEDLDLLVDQATRCRTILADLRAKKDDIHQDFLEYSLTELLDDLISKHRMGELDIEVIESEEADEIAPTLERNPAFIYALGNLINNAAEFAEQQVVIHLNWNDRFVCVHIADDGVGFSDEIIENLGEPFITSREADEESLSSGAHHGMGLGFFIAKTVLERTGAKMEVFNGVNENFTSTMIRPEMVLKGANIILKWSTHDFNNIGDDHTIG